MFLGDSCIGKTTMVEKYCKDNGYYLKTLILSQLEPAEALGVPTVTDKFFQGQNMRVMESSIPSWVFDLAIHEKSVLFLDEFLCGAFCHELFSESIITEKGRQYRSVACKVHSGIQYREIHF